jgi:hypothetical protein
MGLADTTRKGSSIQKVREIVSSGIESDTEFAVG